MKKAIELIREAYAFAGIAPTGTPLNGQMSEEGLGFLNEILYRWNSDNYFPFTNNTVDGHVNGGKAVINPDDGFVPEDGASVLQGPRPINVNKVLCLCSNEWCEVHRVGYENIWERRNRTGSTPYFFAFTNDEQGNGILTFDSESGDFDVRVIYNKDLPAMDFNDELTAPPQYEQAIKYGIAALVCARYGMPPDKQMSVEKLRDSILASIKKTNSFKHMINMPVRNDRYESPADMVMMGRHL